MTARRPTFTRLIGAALITILVLPAPTAFGWGNEGHTWINSVAARAIPPDMPHFFRRAVAELAYLGPEPDRWRNPAEAALKYSQEPDHFIDLEKISWLDPLPRDRYEFYRRLYEKRATVTDHPDDYLPEHVGLQPYITLEVFGRLKSAFREYRILQQAHKPTGPVQHAIVLYAGWLGHYVADGAQPLHTSIQYNGWVGPNSKGYSTQHTIHAQFEGTYVAANITPKDFAGLVHAPAHLSDPFKQYMEYLKQSNALVENVYQLEKDGGFSGKGSAEALRFTTGRLAAGSQMLVDLWYTAWLDSVPAANTPASAPAK